MKYWQYLTRRILGMVVSLVGLSVIIFFTSRILPGNPARMALGPTASQQQVEKFAANLGLNQPIWRQYIDYMSRLLTGHMGDSLNTMNPVIKDIVHYLPATLELITVAILIVIIFGIPLGVVAAQNMNGPTDQLTRLLSFFSVSVPGFFIGILLQLLFGYFLNWFPVNGQIDPSYNILRITGFLLVDTLLAGNLGAFINVWLHILLPATALALAGTGQVIRITRSSMIDIQRKDYIQAEKGFGLPDWLVTYKYTLKNAIIPTLTILGLQYSSMLGNAFLIELVFGWPGVATYGVNAILANDFNAIVGVTLTIGVVFVVVNLVIDLLIGRVDPQTRTQVEGQ